MTTRVRVHIDRLVLDGLPVDARRAPAVRAAVAAELGRLLTERGAGAFPDGGASVPRLDAGSLRLDHAATPSALGTQIARAVHRSAFL